jgi:hypothetical protein
MVIPSQNMKSSGPRTGPGDQKLWKGTSETLHEKLSVGAKTHLIVTDPSEIDHEIRSLSEGLVLKRGYGHCGNHGQ